MVNIKRVRNLQKGKSTQGPVLYWMSRDQRVSDNWALAYAVEMAENNSQPVMVTFCLADDFLGATWRQYDFLLKGLKKVESRLASLNIPFSVLLGDPTLTIPEYIRSHQISHLVLDFDPLKIKRTWQNKVISQLDISIDEVDTHNIVPCYLVSGAEEYAAFTFRSKIKKLLPVFMDEFPPLVRQSSEVHNHRINWEAVSIALKTDHSVRPVEWITPGENGAWTALGRFLEKQIHDYAHKRNDPNQKGTSGLSPYLHFGHISAQRVALEVIKNIPRNEHTDAFLEELIVRRELADNFCYYNHEYDSTSAFKPWARKSLQEHQCDRREYVYTIDQFEEAKTHDTLWNAAQKEMVFTGSMHGYMRMYWAKKILEWSDNHENALRTAIYLNDKYQLDGRDPNGYAGCAWSIGGIHDRPWKDRKIFGKIRYMNRAGCERKFDVDRYIAHANPSSSN